MRMKIGVLQTEIDISRPEKNISIAFELIMDAIHQGCKLMLLPELWYSSFNYNRLEESCSDTRKLLSRIYSTCADHQVYIAGTYITKKNAFYRNSLIISGPSKGCAKIYHKIHLFPEMDESTHFSPGAKKVISKIDDLTLGSAICFDLRFPSLFSYYRSRSVNSMLLPAQWPTKRIDHWRILSRARAIENQFFMIAANGVGKSGDILLGGNSLIIDPLGNILSIGSATRMDLLTAIIDTTQVDLVRSSFPLHQ